MSKQVKQALSDIDTACNCIEREWRLASNDIHLFPDIAMKFTEELDLSVFSDIGNLSEVLSYPGLAKLQAPSSFSDLHFLLFDNSDFYVEVLNWWGSDINIHDHDFSGVQIQVSGSSLNVEYKFEEDICNEGIGFGSLHVSKAELWSESARSFVYPGMPHNVNHLSDPTVSILFRTHPNPNYGPQRNYFAPCVASTYPVHDVIWRKKTKMLRLLSSSVDKKRFGTAFRAVLDGQTVRDNLFTLIKMVDILFTSDLVHLVHEFAYRDDLSNRIAGAAAYYRANEILAKRLKFGCCHSSDEMMCVAALSSVFDFDGFDRIHEELSEFSKDINLWRTLELMAQRIDGPDADTLATLIDMFGLKKANEFTQLDRKSVATCA